MKPTRLQRREVKILCKRFETVAAAPTRRRLLAAILRRLAYRAPTGATISSSDG